VEPHRRHFAPSSLPCVRTVMQRFVHRATADRQPTSRLPNERSALRALLLPLVICGPPLTLANATDPSTFCVHLRLHPGITWSHTAGSPCDVPPLSPTGREVVPAQGVPAVDPSDGAGGRGAGRGDADDERRRSAEGGASDGGKSRQRQPPAVVAADFGLLTFVREEGTGEWNYPWDLTGGLYR